MKRFLPISLLIFLMLVASSAPDILAGENPLAEPLTTIITISTNKTVYQEGNWMKVYVHLVNAGEPVDVQVQIGLELPNGKIWQGFIINKLVTLPANFGKTFTIVDIKSLPSIPEGNYRWHARLKNTLGQIISQDEARWIFSGG